MSGAKMTTPTTTLPRVRRNSDGGAIISSFLAAREQTVASVPRQKSRPHQRTPSARSPQGDESSDSILSVWDLASSGHSMREAKRLHLEARRKRRHMRRHVVWQDGDPTFDSPEMKERRAALLQDPGVAAALDEWWTTTDVDKSGTIDREEYIELGKALYRVMMVMATGWQRNNQRRTIGMRIAGRGHEWHPFREAIFQLCDLWTNTVEPPSTSPS